MSSSKRIFILVGTRPNFIKVTQFRRVAAAYPNLRVEIIHTGQHFDDRMADVFFRQFGLQPDHFLNIAPGSPNRQIAEIIFRLEDLCDKTGEPDFFLVPGDVNSTLAGAVFANKRNIPLGHLEAGLRSYDRTMPEEHNRCVADELSELFFVTEPSGEENLLREGKERSSVHYTGNTMIDTMVAFEREISMSGVLAEYGLQQDGFVLMTMHRPATVDKKDEMEKLAGLIDLIAEKYKVVFPVHPRTVKNMKVFGIYDRFTANRGLILTQPLDYFSFQKLISECRFIVTDSGGIQEESTFRQKPCLTLRPNTERPVTVEQGSNTLLPFDLAAIGREVERIESGMYKKGKIPVLWDGRATERVMAIIAARLSNGAAAA